MTIDWQKVALFAAFVAVPGTLWIVANSMLQRWDAWVMVALWTAVVAGMALILEFPENSRARKLSEWIIGGLALVAIALPILFEAP
ncbi:MAG: hypothetical protein ACKVKF_11675 [Rhodobacterales bacterium]